MKEKRYSVQIGVTVAFALAFVGIEYAQQYLLSMGNSPLFHACEVLIYMCILAAFQVGLVPALLLAVAAPMVMVLPFFGSATLVPSLLYACANVIAVVCLAVLGKRNMLLALGAGAVARFAFAYVSILLVLSNIGSFGDEVLYSVMVDKIGWVMLLTSAIGAALYYVLWWLTNRRKGAADANMD